MLQGGIDILRLISAVVLSVVGLNTIVKVIELSRCAVRPLYFMCTLRPHSVVELKLFTHPSALHSPNSVAGQRVESLLCCRNRWALGRSQKVEET